MLDKMGDVDIGQWFVTSVWSPFWKIRVILAVSNTQGIYLGRMKG